MTKYTRSLQKLVAITKDIFGDSSITIDTKAIVMLLAVSMPSLEFNTWLDKIPGLNNLNARFKELNMLKCTLGKVAYEYTLFVIFKHLEQDVSSEELQQLISDSSHEHLAVRLDQIENSIQAQQLAADILHAKVADLECPSLSVLLDAFLECRRTLDMGTAYTALVAAVADILETSGISTADAAYYSEKLLGYGVLDSLNVHEYPQPILNSYKQGSFLRE